MRQPRLCKVPNTLDWKAILAKAYTKVPKSVGEAVWRLAVVGMVTAAGPGGSEVFLLSVDSGAQPGQRVH